MGHPTGNNGGLLDVDFGSASITPNTDRAGSVIRRRLIMFSLGTLLAFYAYASYGISRFATRPVDDLSCTSHRASVGVDPEMVWDKIKPGTIGKLPWTPCYDDVAPARFCAKLTVPLDYAHPEGGSAVIALIKISAEVAPTDETYKGPILFNPGGPGNSGIGFINTMGGALQQLIGPEFDIVGFDPRGVGRTRPQFIIFPDEAENARFHLQALSTPLWNTSVDAVSRIYANSKIVGSLVDARAPARHVASYVGATLVARDMLSITRAFGREKLQYWGFSYGTILGATFAAMFPDKVERIVIDGVLDADDYYTSTWKKNLQDADKALHLVLQACVDAGPEKCALHESTVPQVHARLTRIFENLKRNPIAVPTKSSVSPAADYGIVDYKSARTFLFMFLYAPYSGLAPILMSAFRALEDGEGEPFWNLIAPSQPPFTCKCKPDAPTIETPDILLAIACGDGLPVNDTVEDLEKWYYELSKQSEFAEWMTFRPSCAGWKVRPVERFSGPWVANTSHPILLVGNTADPVTPLMNAHAMSKGFGGSVVLTQRSGGHCSFVAPSLCTAKAVRTYFRNGTLPVEGTICDTTGSIFGDKDSDALEELVGEDLTTMKAWGTLSEAFSAAQKGIPLSTWNII